MAPTVFVVVVLLRFVVPLAIPRYPSRRSSRPGARRRRPEHLPDVHRRPDAGLPDLRQGARRLLPGDRVHARRCATGATRWRSGSPGSCTSTASSASRCSNCSAGAGCCWSSPNTFEYFFIAYEFVRTRWNPLRIGAVGGRRRWPRSSGSSSSCPRSGGSTSPNSTSRSSWPTTRSCGSCSASPSLPRPSCCTPSAPHPSARLALHRQRRSSPRDRRRRPTATNRSGRACSLEKVVLLALISVIFAQVLPGHPRRQRRDRCWRRRCW